LLSPVGLASWPPPAGHTSHEASRKGSGSSRRDVLRAARHLADAERIASALTNENAKVSALSDVAQALAATDPARAAQFLTEAERIASAIRGGYRR
jgi:hypothetical protein